MKQVIDAFEGKYDWLSNYYIQSYPIFYKTTMFFSVEAAYQAAKYDGKHQEEIRGIFAKLLPDRAKHLGRAIQVRNDWDKVKDQIMYDLVFQKFNRNAAMRKRLLATKDCTLIEGNTWHDNYWGVCHCSKCTNGLNKLGGILMQVRMDLEATTTICVPKRKTPVVNIKMEN